MVEDERIRVLKDGDPRPESEGAAYVLYWMQASQRVLYNHALAEAIARADTLGLPVVVGFGLMDDYPEANARHYAFMLDGLRDVAAALKDKGVAFVLRRGAPPDVALALAKQAAVVVCDRGYLRHQVQWRQTVADRAPCPVIEVETDAVVPVDTVTDKLEHAARTIRPKIEKRLDDFIREIHVPFPKKTARGLSLESEDVSKPRALLKALKLDHDVPPLDRSGGERAAQNRLDGFLDDGIERYEPGRSDPLSNGSSDLSAFLHFGQISPVQIAWRVRRQPRSDSRASFLEELIVRRELAFNFVRFCAGYDSYDGAVPDWAKATLNAHKDDARPAIFTRARMEAAETGDEAWDAAMREMKRTGALNNAVRMYWGKKIIEWTGTPRYAYETALALNNRWFLDGRDPNSFANIAWLFGRHDRPFQERKVLGKVRPYTTAALKRKFDLKAWIAANGPQADLF